MNRRHFLSSLFVAPAIIRVSDIMPIKEVLGLKPKYDPVLIGMIRNPQMNQLAYDICNMWDTQNMLLPSFEPIFKLKEDPFNDPPKSLLCNPTNAQTHSMHSSPNKPINPNNT
jgi:hypothetical protein